MFESSAAPYRCAHARERALLATATVASAQTAPAMRSSRARASSIPSVPQATPTCACSR